MDRCELLLDLLLEYTNLAEINDDIHNVPDLTGYDNSELNCLDCIGRMKDPNVTSIAEAMNMTKGAISKIIRKLSDKGTLVDYQLDGNRQKVYYTLSDKGKTLPLTKPVITNGATGRPPFSVRCRRPIAKAPSGF